MNTKQILEKKQTGDIKQIADMLGITRGNVNVILMRPNSKRYPKVIAALERIITIREKTIREAKQELKQED